MAFVCIGVDVFVLYFVLFFVLANHSESPLLDLLTTAATAAAAAAAVVGNPLF
jgi:hypothetical protein